MARRRFEQRNVGPLTTNLDQEPAYATDPSASAANAAAVVIAHVT